MDLIALEVGRLYALRGGHIVRYQGPHGGWGSSEVLRPLTGEDARGLRLRVAMLKARKMWAEAAWIEQVMAELGIAPSRIPKKFVPTPS